MGIIDGKECLTCRCGYTEEREVDNSEIEKKIQEKTKALEKKMIIVKNEDKVSIHLKVLAECSKCKNTEAEAYQVQTRSADEPATSFFTCTKCGFTWREY